LFINGPVQKRKFSFIDRPGKAVGIRIAAALSAILDTSCLRICGTRLRWRATYATSLRFEPGRPAGSCRVRGEDDHRQSISPNLEPRPQIMTDTNERVAVLALEMIEKRALIWRPEGPQVDGAYVCAVRAHDRNWQPLVPGLRPCRTRRHQGRYSPPIATPHSWVQPTSTRTPAGSLPTYATSLATFHRWLILARSRDHGNRPRSHRAARNDLDPRAGVHVTSAGHGPSTARCVPGHDDYRETPPPTSPPMVGISAVTMARDCATPCTVTFLTTASPGCNPRMRRSAWTQQAERRFETWFLPLVSLTRRNGFPAGQLPGLLKHFRRSWPAR